MIPRLRNVLLRAPLGLALLGLPALAQTTVTLWVHAGPGPEAQAYAASVAAFNQKNKDIKVDLVKLPEGSYSDQVNAAAVAHKLPDLLDFDGPNVYNYAWTKRIVPLDGYPELAALKGELLPSLLHQGTYNGKLYSLGQFDSGLAIWGSRKLLAQAKVRIPAGVQDAWSRAEFEAALKALKANGVQTPLDMKFNYGIGEWISFGFSPLIQSFGGDLIDRNGFRTAQGAINGPGAVNAMTMLQGWIKAGYVNPANKDDACFVKGVCALSYVGHWVYQDYKKALGADLVLIPMPKFGSRAVTGAGSWNFGISADSRNPQAAAKVLAHLMSTPEILRVCQANGAMPGTLKALAESKEYGPKGELQVYVQQAKAGISKVRPETPAYPVITTAFAEAVENILAGAEPKKELDRAASKIDQNIEDNQGYPVH
jgi:multiple sugar transport system substrate-binding protein